MSIKKNILKDALVEAREIENFAIASAKKSIEESMTPKIEQAVKDSIKEYENSLTENLDPKVEEVINEEIKIEVEPGSDLNIKLTDNGLEIGTDKESEIATTEEPSIETNSNQSTEMENTQEDEIFEIMNMEEDAPMAPDQTTDTTITEPISNSPNDIDTKIEDLSKKIDAILAIVNPQNASNSAEGDVQVVDDNEAAPEPEVAPQNQEIPAPAIPTAPIANEQPDENVVNEDDVIFEIEDDIMNGVEENSFMTEDSIDDINLDEIEEIEILDDEIEEIRGVGNAVLRSASNRKDFENKNLHHSPVGHMNENNEIKAQYESKLDGLNKENSRLNKIVQEQKAEIKDFKNSFIELREQVQYMQVFNGKLAYANKVLSKGGLSESEKIKIVEAFDKAETVEEAKKIYKNLVTEMESSDLGNKKAIDKLKTSTPSVIQESSSTKSDVVYESEERKRMRLLAGLQK